MATMRHATMFDLVSIVATRRRQRILRLNPPYTLVQPQALFADLVRSQVPLRPQFNFVYVYTDRGTVQGYVQARCRWKRRDEWTITTLARTSEAPPNVWEMLLEELIRAAGEEGVIRLFVKVPRDEAQLETFRSLGFTHYTGEQIWGNLYFSAGGEEAEDDPYRGLLRRQRSRDAWDLMKLYGAVTPPVVQRAEMITARQWHSSHLPRPWFLSQGLLENSFVWQDETGKSDGLGGWIRLLTGARGHWITLLFLSDPGNRAVVPAALAHVLWKASQHGNKPVYCGLREYQSEAGSLLSDRGFHLLSEQALLVKYLAEPLKERRVALAPFLVNKSEIAPTR